MLFTIHCTDKPDHAALRAATREAHLAYLDALGEAIVHAGPLLDAEGAATGSLLVVEAADRDAAERLAAGDPYATAGLFGAVSISRHRLVIRDGRRVG